MSAFMKGIVPLLVMFSATVSGSAPTRVLLLGDSMMRVPAHALELAMSRKPGVEVFSFSSIGSGLARLDTFDWLVKIDSLTADFSPDTAIVFLGANDRQPMRTDAGIVPPGDTAWQREYAGRVGEAMDRLLRGGVRKVLWLQLPEMRDERLREDVNLINGIVAAQSAAREGVAFVEIRDVVGRGSGRYSAYVIQPNGMPLHVRDPDGIHLNRAGADLIAAHLVDLLW